MLEERNRLESVQSDLDLKMNMLTNKSGGNTNKTPNKQKKSQSTLGHRKNSKTATTDLPRQMPLPKDTDDSYRLGKDYTNANSINKYCLITDSETMFEPSNKEP